MNRKPYVGVTGFMKKEEVEDVLSVMPENSGRMLMVGVLVSLKTLTGQEAGNPNRYPNIHNVKNIFVNHPSALNLVHYNSKDKESIILQLKHIMEEAGSNLHGFQFNMIWPPVRQLKIFKENNPKMRMVLQINESAMSFLDYCGTRLANRVKEYGNGITDILFDLSGGKGKILRTDLPGYYLQYIKDACPNLGLGVAGGLGPNTLGIVEPLIKIFPDISIDAEGRLRDIPEDSLNIENAKYYVKKALYIFGSKI